MIPYRTGMRPRREFRSITRPVYCLYRFRGGPEDRKTIAAELSSRSVPELERIVTSAIRRALAHQLAELEDWAKRLTEHAMVRAKNGKGRNEAAMRIHDEWASRFMRLRNGKAGPPRVN